MFSAEELLQTVQNAHKASDDRLVEQAGLLLIYGIGLRGLLDTARESDVVGDGPLIDDEARVLLLERAIKQAIGENAPAA